ncbi:hypothetical protein, partial [Acinetobacter pittii]|uniref:hypothetical protein n=2 Tax=Acinetobacter pittii TaxID=48296 RepID=UPI00202A38F2
LLIIIRLFKLSHLMFEFAFLSVSSENIKLKIVGNNLNIFYGVDSSVTITDFILNYNIKEIKFSDTVWYPEDLSQKINFLHNGSDGNDIIVGNPYFNNTGRIQT